MYFLDHEPEYEMCFLDHESDADGGPGANVRGQCDVDAAAYWKAGFKIRMFNFSPAYSNIVGSFFICF